MTATTVRLAVSAAIAAALAAGACRGKPEPPAAQAPAAAQPSPTTTVTPTRADVQESINLGGQLVDIVHSRFDGGRIQDLFDGNKETLARTENATTALVECTFPSPRRMSGIDVTTASMDVGLKATLTVAGKPEPLVFSRTYTKLPPDPTVSLSFDGSHEVQKLRLEISNLNGGDGHIHIRELRFK